MDEAFGAPNSGSSSSSSFGDLLGGSLGQQAARSRTRTNNKSFSEDLAQAKLKPAAQSVPTTEELGRD